MHVSLRVTSKIIRGQSVTAATVGEEAGVSIKYSMNSMPQLGVARTARPTTGTTTTKKFWQFVFKIDTHYTFFMVPAGTQAAAGLSYLEVK